MKIFILIKFTNTERSPGLKKKIDTPYCANTTAIYPKLMRKTESQTERLGSLKILTYCLDENGSKSGVAFVLITIIPLEKGKGTNYRWPKR